MERPELITPFIDGDRFINPNDFTIDANNFLETVIFPDLELNPDQKRFPSSENINGTSILEKLDPVPVFTIADSQGAPLVATGDNGEKITGVFISLEDANEFVVQLEEENPELASQVDVVPVSLGEIYQLSVDSDSNNLDFAYVPEDEEVESATDIKNANGNIYQGGVPLFVAKGGDDNGYLTIDKDSSQVIPFFFDLDPLNDLIAKFKTQKPELASNVTVEVVPLEGVIETLETSDDPLLEKIVLVPSEESIEFLSSVNGDDSEGQNVYRFRENNTGVYFYTDSETERDNVINNLDNYTSEGIAYKAVDPITGGEGIDTVYRFRNQNTGVHLYTVSETEKDFIADNLDNYEFEGEVFSAYNSQVEGTIPVHRFYNTAVDAHFYTASEAEKNLVESDFPNFDYEGVAYYAFPADEAV